MSRVKRYGRKRKAWRGILAATGLAAALYVGGIAFFHTHFYPNTKVGSIDIGFRSGEGAKAYVKEELGRYSLTILEKEGEESVSAADAGLSFTDLDKVDRILAGQPYGLWIVDLLKDHDYDELKVQVDEDQLAAYVDTLACMHPASPEESVNASVEYNKDKKEFEIRPETIGNIVDRAHFLEGIRTAMTGHEKEISLVEDTYYVQPPYKADSQEVIEARDTMNGYLKAVVVYKDGGEKLKTRKKDIARMLTYTDDFDVKINKKKAEEYIKEKVSKKFNSLEGDIPSGITAWKVGVDKEALQLIKNIKSGNKTTRKPVYIQKGLERDADYLGRTYIDVNISDQRMWYVEDGKIRLSSDVVTGNLSSGHGTATGFYTIAFKQRDHMMKKYRSFVHYWMPYNTKVGIGFHDASWRSKFGGDIYRTDGSHGCINMPPAKAAELFGMLSTGTAVYIHW